LDRKVAPSLYTLPDFLLIPKGGDKKWHAEARKKVRKKVSNLDTYGFKGELHAPQS
jgi:hypothetical protein